MPLHGPGFKRYFFAVGYCSSAISFMNVAQSFLSLDMEIVKRNESDKWEVLPKRWIVERTFAWLMNFRRLVMDYERTTESAERCLYISMIMDKNYN